MSPTSEQSNTGQHVRMVSGCAVLLCLVVCLTLLASFIKHIHNIHVLMRDERRKKEASKVKQTNKAKQHSTTKAVTFPKKKRAA